MRTKNNFIVFFLLFSLSTAFAPHAHAQLAAPGGVKNSLLSLAARIQMVVSSGQVYDPEFGLPLNRELATLGHPLTAVISEPTIAQGVATYNGRVFHEHGVSEWTIVLLYSGQIVTYTVAISRSGQNGVDLNPYSNVLPGPTPLNPYSNALPTSPPLVPYSNPSPSNPPLIPYGNTNPIAPPAFDPRVVEFLFASTRKLSSTNAATVSYSGERGPLTFGAASVRIPDDYKIGRIEIPSSWKIFGITFAGSPNEHKHFIIKRVVSLSPDKFDQLLKEKSARSALVFVHGFNTSFEDALYRNAQIVWDLQYPGLSILFTWASRGDVTDYLYDKESAYLARLPFIQLLEKLRREYGVEQINVLAHSMGNLIVLDELASYAQTSNPIKITHLMMAAPDVDRDQFISLAPIAKKIVGGITLYASSADRALMLSKGLAGGIPRAGDVPAGGPIILPGVETIDVTAVGDSLFGLNHDTFAGSRDVIEDISAVLLDRPPPGYARSAGFRLLQLQRNIGGTHLEYVLDRCSLGASVRLNAGAP